MVTSKRHPVMPAGKRRHVVQTASQSICSSSHGALQLKFVGDVPVRRVRPISGYIDHEQRPIEFAIRRHGGLETRFTPAILCVLGIT